MSAAMWCAAEHDVRRGQERDPAHDRQDRAVAQDHDQQRAERQRDRLGRRHHDLDGGRGAAHDRLRGTALHEGHEATIISGSPAPMTAAEDEDHGHRTAGGRHPADGHGEQDQSGDEPATSPARRTTRGRRRVRSRSRRHPGCDEDTQRTSPACRTRRAGRRGTTPRSRGPGARAPNPIKVWPSTRSPIRCRTPAPSSGGAPVRRASGTSSASRSVAITTAAATNDAASSRATAQPPSQVKSSAPSSGPKRRKASLVVCSGGVRLDQQLVGHQLLEQAVERCREDDEADAVARTRPAR